jgi:hypothetical protein
MASVKMGEWSANMAYDNPAKRLLAVLEAGKKLPGNGNCRESWKALLKTDEESEMLGRLGKTMSLCAEIIRVMSEEHPEHSASWTHWNSQVIAAFMGQNLLGDWATFISKIDTHSLHYLGMTATLLEHARPTKVVTAEELAQLRERFQALQKQVLEADLGMLPARLRQYLVQTLHRLLAAIDEYHITGATSLLDAAEGAYGHAVVDSEYRSFLKTELGRRWAEAIQFVANVATVAQGLAPLGQSIVAPLLGA